MPSAAYTEQDGIYVNIEGRPQYARRAVCPIGQAKEDFEIFSIIARALKIEQWPSSLAEVRELMAKDNKVFANIDVILKTQYIRYKSSAKIESTPISRVQLNYYMTDPISRNSASMARCTKAIAELNEERAANHGGQNNGL